MPSCGSSEKSTSEKLLIGLPLDEPAYTIGRTAGAMHLSRVLGLRGRDGVNDVLGGELPSCEELRIDAVGTLLLPSLQAARNKIEAASTADPQ